ncbi:ABC-three component system protein [Sphingobacterium faecium]|uniref:ABC-three component system protein n=1 Tax=Sphingobacterium faecium TaxID=34087 RepID=UPI00320B7004
MLAKLRLDQTKKYEQAIATYEISCMLLDFVLGRKHYLCIGSEQGGILKWDDIVIENDFNSQIHIQVKRQTSEDFGTHKDLCIRNLIDQGPRKGKLRDLSPLDETMKSLADWFKGVDILTMSPKREFWIELPELNTKIKNELTIKNLCDLCGYIKPAVTTKEGLERLAIADKNVKNCYEWLTTWCDFENWEHILKVLQFLRIKNSGLEEQINSNAESKLKDIFVSDKVKEVLSRITAYTNENSTFSGAIGPRNLLYELKKYLRTETNFWTQYDDNGSKWSICGTQDLEFNAQIERTSVLVPNLWNNAHLSQLKVNAKYKKNCKLSESLMRIAIHQSSGKMSYFTGKTEWEHHLKSKIGNTLGLSDNDTSVLNILENNDRYLSSETRTLLNLAEQEADALELNSHMLVFTWKAVKYRMTEKIMAFKTNHSNELRNTIDERWRKWLPLLDNSPEEQRSLFRKMLHPNAEGKKINSDMRIGPKTVGLLTDALLLLLICSVCLDFDGIGNWNSMAGIYNANAIALQYWSGLSDEDNGVKEVIEDCREVIGMEDADLLIFSKIQASHSEVLGLKMDEPVQKENTLAEGKQLKMLITYNIQLRHLIDKGEIKSISDYLNNMLIKKHDIL